MGEELRKLLNPRGTEVKSIYGRRREIVKYIAAHPGCTPYEIAKSVFGDGVKYAATVIRRIKRMERIGGVQFLMITRREDGAYCVSLTEQGKTLCKNEGLILPSDRADAFVYELNKLLDLPLTVEETKTLKGMLSEKVLDTLDEIARESRPPVFTETAPVSQLDALWFYEAEKSELLPKVESGELLSQLAKSPQIYAIAPQLRNLPPDVVRKEIKRACRKLKLDRLIIENLRATQIARKNGVEAELDRLADFLKKIEGRGKLLAESRKKALERYAFFAGTLIQTLITSRILVRK